MSDRPAWLNRMALPELSPEVFELEAESAMLWGPADVASFILDQRAAIRTQRLTALAAAARYSDVMDAAMRRMLSLARLAIGSLNTDSNSGLAIVATGGYGRRELAPFSDIDVNFVPAREDDASIDALVRTLFQLMMDALVHKAALKVGYAYRLLEDSGSLELQTQTSLIDARFVAGDYSLFCDFRHELRQQMNPARFIFDKNWERSVARENAGGTIYRVEPDLKNGMGGLREIHTATWMAQARFGIWSPAVWEELIDRDVVSFRQVERLFEALEFLQKIRNALHWRAGKQNDLLMMAQQGHLADSLNFKGHNGLTPSQELMAAYFKQVEHINLVAKRVINWVLESRLDLGFGLACVRRRIECASIEIFLSRPANIVQAFLLSQSLGIPLSPDLETTIRAAIEGPRALQPANDCGPLLMRILESPDRIWATLDSMANLGVLGWILFEFAPLMNLPPRDPSHEFTVGFHSLLVVRRLEEMRNEPQDSFFREVFSHLDYPALLFLAGLLHDAGKALEGPGHPEKGAALIPAIGIRLGLQPHQVQKLRFLVAQHLLMSEISRFRDLNQEGSVRELVKVVADQEALDQLYLLTHADGTSVGKGIWSPVQDRFLEELYHRASQMLARAELDTREVNLQRYQKRVTRALTGHNLAPEEVAKHVELMPASYLLNTPSDAMAMHIEMVQKVQVTGKPSVEFQDDRGGQFTELIICARDDPRPGLLSKVAGCLWSSDIAVHSAQVFTREGDPRIAIDNLWIDFHGRNLEPHQKRRVEVDLVEVLTGSVDVRTILEARGKGSDLDSPLHECEVLAHRSEDHLICEFRAGDRRGLLYRLTRTISDLGWHIHSARIGSVGARTRDVFYIGEPTGIPAEEAARLLSNHLLTPARAA